jgi:hypothetical protein
MQRLAQQVVAVSELDKRLQVLITSDAYRRIKMAAAKEDLTLGQVVTWLAEMHLPSVEAAA